MRTIASLGLKACSDCKYRFDCVLKPKVSSVHYEDMDNWIKYLVGTAYHPTFDFDGMSVYNSDAKCICQIRENFKANSREALALKDDIVVLSVTFFNELLLYARHTYPNFERRE